MRGRDDCEEISSLQLVAVGVRVRDKVEERLTPQVLREEETESEDGKGRT